MRRAKAAVNILVGLLFLAQGVAVAASPIVKTKAAEPTAAMQMHCHPSQDAPAQPQKSCPCHHACPAMAHCGSCVLASPAIGFAAPAMEAAPVGAFQTLPEEGAVPSAVPSSPLRPPISLHG